MNSIHLKDIKKDQVFFERGDYGCGTLKMIALEDAYVAGDFHSEGSVYKQWRCKARRYDAIAGVDDEPIDYLVTENHEHYGPKLYAKSSVYVAPEYKLSKILESTEEVVLLGSLVIEPQVAQDLIMLNEDELLFRSSKIANIEEASGARIITTQNSKYKLEKI